MLNEQENALLKQIDAEDVTTYCQKLVRIPSISGSEHKLSEEITKDLRSFGFEVILVQVSDSGPCVVGKSDTASLPNKAPSLVFNGHMDTVPVCSGWTRDPFSAQLEGNRLYGLGSLDMKGGLAAIIMAAKALNTSNLKLRKPFAVHAVTDEEIWSRGTMTLLREGFYDNVECCIIGEPSDLSRLRSARRGRCLVDVIVQGKAAHGAQPEDGINAIVEAAKVIHALSDIPERTHPRLLDTTLNPMKSSTSVLKIEGGADSLSIPDKCVIRVDRHILPGSSIAESTEQITSHLKQRLEEDTFKRIHVQFTPRPTPPPEPFQTDPDSTLVKTILDASHCLGHSPELVAGLSVADDCLIAAHARIPVVSYGPGGGTASGGGVHQSDEHVLIPQVVDAARIYALTAYRILTR
jgi:acetylornithine deacetylase/succinyl-diaminopimelate desuccinylase family protein